jgi:hypothetical protein
VKGKLPAIVSEGSLLSAVEGGSNGVVDFELPSSVPILSEKLGEAAVVESVVCSCGGAATFVVVGSFSSGMGVSFVDVLDG